jgi:hypothetical protein
MFSKWKEKLGALGTLLLAVITWLGFFGIDARTIQAKMTTHYFFLIAALVFTSLFALSLRYLWRITRVTPENVHLKLRQWLDALNISHCVVPREPWHFRYDVIFWGQGFYVGRPKDNDHYLYVELRTGVIPEHAKAFGDLPDVESES